jgi:glucose-6-phosphate 1-epimerase
LDNLKYTLQGAHIFHWQPIGASHPIFFTSDKALFEKGKAIRGGVPICWPWFGPKEGLSQHGFARTAEWRLVSDESQEGKRKINLALSETEESKKIFPYNFHLSYSIEEEGNILKLSLTTLNTDDKAFLISPALHSYFFVGDVSEIKINGLQNVAFIDKVESGNLSTEGSEYLGITSETDRIYLGSSTNKIYDSSLSRSIKIDHMATATVVWNPWLDKCKAMVDMADDEYRKFVCVESAVMPDEILIHSGQAHILSQTIELISIV